MNIKSGYKFRNRENAVDPWWGIPTGGQRTEQERQDRAVVHEVQKVVRERLRASMISSLQSLQTNFAKLDKSGDGLLSKEELINGLEQTGLDLTPEQIESVWRIVDEDKVSKLVEVTKLIMNSEW